MSSRRVSHGRQVPRQGVIVTGAASGIGEATARRFVTEGAKVALVDRDKASLEEVAKSLPADQVTVQATDVSDRVPSIEWSRLSSTAWAGWTSS